MNKSKLLKQVAQESNLKKELRALDKRFLATAHRINEIVAILEKIKNIQVIDNIPVMVLESIDGLVVCSPPDLTSNKHAFLEKCKSRYIVKYFSGSSEKFKSSSPLSKKEAMIHAARWVDGQTVS